MAASAGVGFPVGAGAANLDVSWIHGSEAAKYNTDPDIQVHAYDEHTYLLRQNMAVHYEAPFMFLLFGGSRAVLIDTGATSDPRFFPLRRTVDAIIDGWLASHPHAGDYGLLVLHTHSHTDHTAGDSQFADRPDTTFFNAQSVFSGEEYHGTIVASVAAAPANGVGIVGVYPTSRSPATPSASEIGRSSSEIASKRSR